MWFLLKVKRPLYYFHIQVKKVHPNILDFCRNPKNLIFRPFFRVFGPSWPVGTFFFQNLISITFLTLRLSNFMQKKIRRKCGANSEILQWEWMDGWMDRKMAPYIWWFPLPCSSKTRKYGNFDKAPCIVSSYL